MSTDTAVGAITSAARDAIEELSATWAEKVALLTAAHDSDTLLIAALKKELADCQSQQPPSGPTMLVGASIGARKGDEAGVPRIVTTRNQEFTRVEQLLGVQLGIQRSFEGGFPSTFAKHSGGVDVGKRVSSISVKSDPGRMARGEDNALVASLIQSIPDGHRCYVTWQHEAENPKKGNDAALIRAAGNRFGRLVQDTRTDTQDVSVAWTIMGWTFHVADRNPLDWYWGDNAVEVIAPDCYAMHQTRYVPLNDPRTGAPQAYAFAAEHGKRFGLNEWGCLDHPGTDRPRFIAEADAWLRSLTGPRCEFACWYHAYDSAPDGIGHWLDTTNSAPTNVAAYAVHARGSA